MGSYTTYRRVDKSLARPGRKQAGNDILCSSEVIQENNYRGADKSLARPGRKEANVSVGMAWISFGVLPCRKKKKLDDSSRLDVVEIARVPGMLPSLFPSWSG